MEFDVSSIERKFYDTIVPVRIKPDAISAPTCDFAHILGVSSMESGHAQISGRWKKTGKAFTAYTKTGNGDGQLDWPRLTFDYWLPEIRVYKVREAEAYATLSRKPGKFFKVGLNDQCYKVRLIGSNLTVNVHHIDLYNQPQFGETIWTKNIYVTDEILHFNNLKIGLISKNKLFLDDPDFEFLLPTWVKVKWQVSHL